ncbi:MAG TPA: TAXI family TRAP transporter solute-binding subunit [Noviherbaspirillum sp.]|nr:TAXI family TRAP transporter solute-binding subunit [Noviherbaspirillum sp.]
MSRIFSFSRISLRGLLFSAGPVLMLLAAACLLAYWIVDPSPPPKVTLSTGQENSAYEEIGKRYAAQLARMGVKVDLVRSLGSQENLDRLVDPRSGVGIAFVQSGSTEMAQAERQGLVSLGSLFTEPVWLFMRERKAVTRLSQLRGMKVNVGPEGTGVPQLFKRILAVNGIEPGELALSGLENTPATVALLEGQIDALVFSSAPDAPLVQMLLQTPGIRLFDFAQAEAYTRRLPFLSHVVLPRGIVDLGRDLPARDYHLIAPTATLVARADLHPALVDLFVHAAAQIHNDAGWFQRRGEFPNANYTEIPVASSAQKYYRSGPPFLQRYLPFWLANLFDRMWVIVVALGALMLPLSRIVPPLYVWQVRSRVYRWYGQLRAVEQALEEVPQDRRADVYREQLERLNEIEDRVNHIAIPLSFADELYGLRSHIGFVRRRIAALMEERAGEPA